MGSSDLMKSSTDPLLIARVTELGRASTFWRATDPRRTAVEKARMMGQAKYHEEEKMDMEDEQLRVDDEMF